MKKFSADVERFFWVNSGYACNTNWVFDVEWLLSAPNVPQDYRDGISERAVKDGLALMDGERYDGPTLHTLISEHAEFAIPVGETKFKKVVDTSIFSLDPLVSRTVCEIEIPGRGVAYMDSEYSEILNFDRLDMYASHPENAILFRTRGADGKFVAGVMPLNPEIIAAALLPKQK